MKKYLVILTAALALGCWTCDDKEETPVIAVTSVSVSPTSVSIVEGTSATVTATVLPEDADNKAVAWGSANDAVATVAAGVITGIAPGTTTVTVTTADGGRTAAVAVTVTAAPVPVTGVSVEPTEVTIVEGTAATVTATVAPADATNKNVAWTSSSDAIATVANGVVTGVAPGTATITVTTEDGGHTATVAVTVDITLILNTPAADAAVVLNKTTPTAEVAFSWTTNAPAGTAFELVLSQNSDLSNPLQSVPVTAANKAFTHQELQDLLFTGATLTAGIKRYKPNTLYWNVKVGGDYLAPVRSFTLTGMPIFKDVRGTETITYDVTILNYGGEEHIWMAENLRTKKFVDGSDVRWRPAAASGDIGPGSIVLVAEVRTTFATSTAAGENSMGPYVSAAARAKILELTPLLYNHIPSCTTLLDNIIPPGWKVPSVADMSALVNAAGASPNGIWSLYHPDAFSDDFAEQKAVVSTLVPPAKSTFNVWNMNMAPGIYITDGTMGSFYMQYLQIRTLCKNEGENFYRHYRHQLNLPDDTYDGSYQFNNGSNINANTVRLKYIGE